MKLAITSEGNNINAKLDARFARSQYWYIYDTEKKDGYFLTIVKILMLSMVQVLKLLQNC